MSLPSSTFMGQFIVCMQAAIIEIEEHAQFSDMNRVASVVFLRRILQLLCDRSNLPLTASSCFCFNETLPIAQNGIDVGFNICSIFYFLHIHYPALQLLTQSSAFCIDLGHFSCF